jgi:hypothetical protein
LVVGGGLLLWSTTPALLLYATLAIAGSWVYPLLTVHLPHKDFGDTPLTQTHTLRGRIIPAIFLELTYHLEHHLYPQVPSHPPGRTRPPPRPLPGQGRRPALARPLTTRNPVGDFHGASSSKRRLCSQHWSASRSWLSVLRQCR